MTKDCVLISNIDGGHLMTCVHCGAKKTVALPMDYQIWKKETRAFQKAHRACPAPVTTGEVIGLQEARIRQLEMELRECRVVPTGERAGWGTCRTCRHWQSIMAEGNYEMSPVPPSEWGYCSQVAVLRDFWHNGPPNQILVGDLTGHRPLFGGDFGCTHWQPAGLGDILAGMEE